MDAWVTEASPFANRTTIKGMPTERIAAARRLNGVMRVRT